MASPRVAALLRTVAEARVLLAIGTGVAPPRAAWLVAGPDYWRERGAWLVCRGMAGRVGVHRVQVIMYPKAARPARITGRGSKAIEPVLCGLCGRAAPPGDLGAWAAQHPLMVPGTSRRHV